MDRMVLVDVWREVIGFKIYLEGRLIVIANKLYFGHENAFGISESG